MTWMAKLYETYENARKLHLPDKVALMPISHILQNAHINIAIDQEGNFKYAKVLEKTKIILPATEQSAGRTRGIAAHALADKLRYVAKDCIQYGGVKKSYFDSYKTQLCNWCESPFCHPTAKAVYRYIEKGHVIKDLIQSKIVFINNNNNMLLTCWKNKGKEEVPIPSLFKVLSNKKGELDQGNALVCWTVEVEGDLFLSSNTWEDESLQKSWVKYNTASSGSKEGLCYVLGKRMPLAMNHPAKLRNTGDIAKLISFNDTSGYTYRGRFIDNTQACGIGFDVTQKAHNALRWLISRQDYYNGNQIILAWAVSLKDVPSLMVDSYKLLEDDNLNEIGVNDKEASRVVNYEYNLDKQFALKFSKKIAGYRAQFDDIEKIIIMGLDSATPGRISITYYRELNANLFFDRLASWHISFAWPQRYNKRFAQPDDKKQEFKVMWAISSPALKRIAEAAYGQELHDNLDKSTIARLLPCIIDEEVFPKDLVDACVRRASNPSNYKYKERWLWRRNISIACALFKGYYSDRNPNIKERRNYQMSLERERTSRDYLYGRLLALAEQIENKLLENGDEKNSITYAERLMQRFSLKPFTTWKTIDESLSPYRTRLKISNYAGLLQYWEKEIQKICDLFDCEDFANDNPLTGEYLLGYYCQKNYKNIS